MRLRPLLLTVPLLLAVAACGGNDDDAAVQTPTSTTSSTPAPASASASASATSSPTGSAAGTVTALTGTIGTPDDPEAYEIGLVDASGAPVRTLPAGSYAITVDDRSFMHNFHLTGNGVDESTGVSAKEKEVFTVTLSPGTYEFVCDPHTGSMSGSFTVT